MGLKLLSYLPAIIGLFTLSFFIFLNNPRNIVNRIFAALNVVTVMWLVFLFLADTSTHNIFALWFLRGGLFFGQLLFPGFLYFALYFPYKTSVSRLMHVLIILPSLVVAFALLTTLGVQTVKIEDFGVNPANIGPLYTFSDVLGLAYLIVGIVVLLAKYRHSLAKQQSQIKIVLLGLTIAIFGNVFSGLFLTLLHVDTNFILFGSFSMFIFSLFVAYAMLRHGFLDIRLLVARTVAFVLSIGFIVGVYSVLLFEIVARIIPESKITVWQQVLYIAVAVVLALTFQPIKKFFAKLSDKFLYQDAYDPQELFGRLNGMLVSSLEMHYLMTQSVAIIEDTIKPSYALVGLKGEGNTYRTFSKQKLDFSKKDIEAVRKLTPLLGHQKVIVAGYLDEERYPKLRELMMRNNVAVIVRLTQNPRSREEGLGYLVLGPRKSGNPYTDQDARVLDTVGNELTIAIQNVLHYEEIQQFNIQLQGRVEEATRKLRRTNDKLKALDETKDDFISMASHQLRTPLTSVKGYLSMVLEGDAGKLNAAQQKMLNQAFISSQRMVYLIADLLNVSRLRTGKFVIEPHPTNLAVMIEEELAQLVETAKGREIELTYNKPKDFPELMLDETKTRQVVMNFVDNAIYYTPAGGHIKVELRSDDRVIELRVVDDGIGVPKAEQHHLFTKFYRAGNARKARPDGTGLGLFMAKKVVLAQGGSIIFESTEGKGSTFGFAFSRSKLAVQPAATAPAMLKVAKAPAKSKA